MDFEEARHRDRIKLAVLERLERTVRHTTDLFSIACGIACAIYFLFLGGFLLELFPTGLNVGFAALIAAGFSMLILSPAIFLFEKFEKVLSAQIAEASV